MVLLLSLGKRRRSRYGPMPGADDILALGERAVGHTDLADFSTNLRIASINPGGGDARYDSECRMNVKSFMAPPLRS
jgi:hypothetical protein